MPASVKKPTASSGSKKKSTTAKKTAGVKKSQASTAKKAAVKHDQHREVWVVVTFFASLVLIFAMLGVNGGVLTPLSKFLRGLIGVGAYVLPFSVLGCCMIIVFAHGKPIAAQVICVMIIPVFVGMIAHLVFSDVELKEHVIPLLYNTGKTWESGGVIAGGIAALMASAISEVLSIILVFVFLSYSLLRCANIRIPDIIEFFFGMHEESKKRRIERDQYEDERLNERFEKQRKNNIPPVIEPEPIQPERNTVNKAREDRLALIDIPIDAEPVYPPKKTETVKTDDTEKTETQNDIKSDVQPARDIQSAKHEEDKIMQLEQNISVHQIPPVFIETAANKAAVFDTAVLPDIRQREPQPISDEEMLTELTGLDAELTREMPSDPEYLREDVPDEDDFEKLENEMIPLSENVDDSASDQPNAALQMEPAVLDTHQLVTETVDSPLSAVPVKESYRFPPLELLREEEFIAGDDVSEELRSRSHKLADTLQSFGVQAQISNVIRGPSVTRYEILLERGVKISRLTTLQDDIALALGASGVRIAAIPDKSAVGIEVPNKVVQTVYLREVLSSRNMSENKSKLAYALGKDITGTSIIGDISKMPHMLIAGTTGSGKSVCINSIIISLLYRSSPDEVRLIMIDPKMVELGNYNGIPHLLVPVVTDYKKAAGALNWAVMEMERRYKRMFEVGARDLDSYNSIVSSRGEETMPRIVIIIDELADLMMMAAKEIEESVCRIAQKARAAGMHLIIATQRPSSDVLTGLMKSNIPSRIAFAVASQIESRIILDQNGAEKLIGRGDMLYFPLGIPKPVRIQGCFLSSSEVEAVTEYIKNGGEAQYSQEILDHMERSASSDSDGDVYGDDDETDDRFDEAVDIVVQLGQASASLLQRKLKLGYARAGRIIDQMENRGIIGPPDGSKPRQVLLSRSDWSEMKVRRTY